MENNNFIYKDGEIKFFNKDDARTDAERVKSAQQPFMQLSRTILDNISRFLSEQKDVSHLDTRDMLVIVVGAMAYSVGHFYNFMSRIGSVKDLDTFLDEFCTQVRLSLEIFRNRDKGEPDDTKK